MKIRNVFILMALAVFAFTVCDPDKKSEPKQLTGTVKIGGEQKVGETATIAVENHNAPANGSFTYQWTADGVEIAGANGISIVIPEEVAEKRLGGIVGHTSTDVYGTITGQAATVVEALIQELTGTLTISIDNNAELRVGETARISITGSNGTEFTYQWTANGVEIANENGISIVIPASIIGKTLGAKAFSAGHSGHISGQAAGTVQAEIVPETPELRNENITFDFPGSATVTGTLLQEEWDAVLDQIPRIMNERYAAAPEGGAVQARYDFVFNQHGVTITVEKSDDYDNWKTGADGKTLRLNFNAIDNWSSIINAAVRAMDEFNATQARVIPTKPSTFLSYGTRRSA